MTSLKKLITSSPAPQNEPNDKELSKKFFTRRITNLDLYDPDTVPYFRTNGKKERFPVSFAASLPDGFNPGDFYHSRNHPRGLQMAIFAVNDALQSAGLGAREISAITSADRIAVYAGSGLGQLDLDGMGGVLTSTFKGQRTLAKQLPFSYPQMSADFVNAYVLNNLGRTGNCCGACATFLYNLELAVNNIKNNMIDFALVGASEAPIIPDLISAFYNMGAMIGDAKVEGQDFFRASMPFGDNHGFVMGESAQFIVLASPEFAAAAGASVRGAVPNVFVNADGPKKSISSPGLGNYLSIGRSVQFTSRLLGGDKVANSSYVHAHGTSTPQNRVTESRILSKIAGHFNISDWPIVAIKSYLGHSQACGGGDQAVNALGLWNYGVLPGITTIEKVADDVETANIDFNIKHRDIGTDGLDISFINAKGFGGNNATAIFFSPDLAQEFYHKEIGRQKIAQKSSLFEERQRKINDNLEAIEDGKFKVLYEMAEEAVTDEDVRFEGDTIVIKDNNPIHL